MLVFFDIQTRPRYFNSMIDCLVHAISAFSECKEIAHYPMTVQTWLEIDSYLWTNFNKVGLFDSKNWLYLYLDSAPFSWRQFPPILNAAAHFWTFLIFATLVDECLPAMISLVNLHSRSQIIQPKNYKNKIIPNNRFPTICLVVQYGSLP